MPVLTKSKHGAPGSQNGWEETGLVGPILFTANQSNSDRSLNVLKNLTQEFSQSKYGGVVTSKSFRPETCKKLATNPNSQDIELLNEPIFDVSDLKTFYTAASNVVGAGNSSGINVTIHGESQVYSPTCKHPLTPLDAFYNPPYWKNYNPNNADATSPAEYLTVDTHQFWAFPPFTNLSESAILQAICDFGMELKVNNSGIPPSLVGEWSLSTGRLTASGLKYHF